MMAGESVAPYHVTVVNVWFKDNFIQHEKGKWRKKMSDLIEQANIFGQFVYKKVYMTFKVKRLVNEDPQEFCGIHSSSPAHSF